jgi:hypothetical protein
LAEAARAAAIPFVVLDFETPLGAGDPELLAKNIGQGLAINVILIEDPEGESPTFSAVGAIAAGARLRLPPRLFPPYAQTRRQPDLVWLLAESARRSDWVFSSNRRSEGGVFQHATEIIPRSAAEQLTAIQVPLVNYLQTNWQTLRPRLHTLAHV